MYSNFHRFVSVSFVALLEFNELGYKSKVPDVSIEALIKSISKTLITVIKMIIETFF